MPRAQAPTLLSLIEALTPTVGNHHWNDGNALDLKIGLLHDHLKREEVLTLNDFLNFFFSFLI
jgi:hypothetical protein